MPALRRALDTSVLPHRGSGRLHGAYAHDLPPESRDWGVSGTAQRYHQLYTPVTAEFRAIGCGTLTVYEASCTPIETGDPTLPAKPLSSSRTYWARRCTG